MKLLDLLTENDGTSLCPARIIGVFAAMAVLYKFVVTVVTIPDYVALATGIGIIMAAIAGNKMVEGKHNANS